MHPNSQVSEWSVLGELNLNSNFLLKRRNNHNSSQQNPIQNEPLDSCASYASSGIPSSHTQLINDRRHCRCCINCICACFAPLECILYAAHRLLPHRDGSD